MTNTLARKFIMFSAVLAFGGSLYAADPVEVKWKDFCRVAGNRQLEITTDTGETVIGYCASITGDEVGLTVQDKIVKYGRTALSHIQIERVEGHQLRSLGRQMREAFKSGTDMLFSPDAPLGILAVPGTLAWGAIAAPFCLLGDLRHHLLGKEEIKLV